MRRTWAGRAAVAVGTWAAICGVGLFYRLSPQPLLIGVVVLAVAAVCWLAVDVGGSAEMLHWEPVERVRHLARGADTRTTLLQRSLADPNDDRAYTRHLHPVLVAVVDDRLLRHHGIDRRRQPHQARAVLGDDLADFLRQPTPSAAGREPRHLDAILTRIESL